MKEKEPNACPFEGLTSDEAKTRYLRTRARQMLDEAQNLRVNSISDLIFKTVAERGMRAIIEECDNLEKKGGVR